MLLKVGLGLTVIAVLLVVAWSQQRILVYAPDPTRVDPAEGGLAAVGEVTLRTPDGVKLIAWYGAAQPGQPTLLYFHGNAGNLLSRAGRMGEYLSKGRGMLMLSYRGYGGSGGKPTEANNVADAGLAYHWLLEQGVKPADIIVYGESLGSGVGVQLAEKHSVGGIILDAPYTSIADVGARIYPFLPVQALILDRYDSLSRIDRINAPLLIVHGDQDDLIPIDMGRKLFDRAREPKQFSAIAGGGHADHWMFGSYDVIHSWIDRPWRALRHTQVSDNSEP
ncbi:MAG: alpha/beta hydrolase [Hyphomicrobiaceae bacterium]